MSAAILIYWNIFYPHRETKAVQLLQYAFGESPTKSDQWCNDYSGQISDEKQMCDNNMLHKGMMNKQKWAYKQRKHLLLSVLNEE